MIDIIIKPNIKIIEAMKILENTIERCLIVVDKNNKLLGTLTDGDIRRKIITGGKFSESISSVYNQNPKVLYKNKYKNLEAKQILSELKLDLIPIIDEKRTVINFVTIDRISGKKEAKNYLDDIPVVIMAGGKGSRLDPFTKILPKPLLPVKGKTIIEHIIDSFLKFKCHEFYLTLNYKSNIIKSYFRELSTDYNINFVNESKPLGTAGSLCYLTNKFKYPFFVTNCDIIIKTDYLNIYKFHQQGKYDITLVASAKEYIIPYGTCELDKNGLLIDINEKPKYNFFVNTGLYVINPDILKLIPAGTFYHITNLIQDAKKIGKRIGIYPIKDDLWTDVGQWEEYNEALNRF